MSESDNIDLNDHNFNSHNSDKNQLWNEELLKNYALNIMNLLKSSYFTFSEILSILLIVIIYWIFNEHDEDSHNSDFESWKTVFTAERLIQFKKIQWLWYWIKKVKNSIIKKSWKLSWKFNKNWNHFIENNCCQNQKLIKILKLIHLKIYLNKSKLIISEVMLRWNSDLK